MLSKMRVRIHSWGRVVLKSLRRYFSKGELLLWAVSSGLILLSFLFFDRENVLVLCASLVGAVSLLLNAKGNPVGQFCMILFSLLYGVISYTFSYYGEMITYLGMTAPMALFALISWLRHPYEGNRAEVTVNRLKKREVGFMLFLAAIVTLLFYFILRSFNTANLLPSTLSVTTSFLAVYLTFRRSACYALAYAANDLVLILLWTLAVLEDSTYISVIVCFFLFFVNDIYGFLSWRKMGKRQRKE
ncbi:nicotinamide riboside transporter PnuC [Neglectibacter caecimuris]|uniref:nicotinamide riboside transporter PnuC n=1 Tax=Neglectibacter caecimuris TaxID=3093658 RepID=UPI002AC8ADF3|nr:nicotinamide riboside transporter PnuC [Neglectibacter sp. M00184]